MRTIPPRSHDDPRAPRSSAAHSTGDVEANGVRYYYGIHGAGEPLLLLHGGLGNIDMFGPVLPARVRFCQLLGGGLRDAGWMREHMSPNRLAILPGATHDDLFLSPRLLETVVPFLDGESDASTWAEQVAEQQR